MLFTSLLQIIKNMHFELSNVNIIYPFIAESLWWCITDPVMSFVLAMSCVCFDRKHTLLTKVSMCVWRTADSLELDLKKSSIQFNLLLQCFSQYILFQSTFIENACFNEVFSYHPEMSVSKTVMWYTAVMLTLYCSYNLCSCNYRIRIILQC